MTAMPGAHTCTIDRLLIRGAALDTGRVLAELQRSDWGQHNRRWYFLRRLEIHTSRTELSRDVQRHCQASLARAFDGCRRGAADKEAVYFEDLDNLLAQLSLDLLSGRAPYCWYWRQWLQRFSARPEQDLLSQWCSHVDRLPEVVAILQTRGGLARIWRSLDEDQFHELIASFAGHRGLDRRQLGQVAEQLAESWQPVDMPPPSPAMADTPAVEKGGAPVSDLNDPGPTLARWQAGGDQPPGMASAVTSRLPNTLMEPWSGVLADTDKNRPRARLMAALLVLEQWNPGLKTRGSHWRRRLLSLARSLGSALLPDQPLANMAAIAATSTTGNTACPPKAPNPRMDQAPTTDPATRPDMLAERAVADLPQETEEATANGFRIHTAHGGLFYLINVINACRAILEFDDSEAVSGSGWRLLYQLGLSLRPSDQPPYDAPLQHLFLRACALDEADQLLSPDFSPQCRRIVATLSASPRLHVLWRPELLSREAEVVLSRSHLDVYLREQDTDLAVRLAGLDIDPGWVDWLGRVVHFHYRREGTHHG